MFVPLAREGWLQKLVASPGRPFGAWRVLWVELLEDGKLSWFDSARKRKSDFRRAPHDAAVACSLLLLVVSSLTQARRAVHHAQPHLCSQQQQSVPQVVLPAKQSVIGVSIRHWQNSSG
jgi:hypothetical protein